MWPNFASWFLILWAVSMSVADEFKSSCADIVSKLDIANGTVWFAQYVPKGTNLTFPDADITCLQEGDAAPVIIHKDMCRIALVVSTSDTSQVSIETWLPRDWSGRFLSTGNGGLGGCIMYSNLAYTSSLGFASASGNNGHNGTGGEAFLNNPETVADFAYRSVHTSATVGKEITNAFYGRSHKKSYYFGCSTGGRQGWKEAQDFPEDFDGIVAGSPAHAFGNLTGWSGSFFPITGTANSSDFIPYSLWEAIHQDVLKQCDGLDGAIDGIVETAVQCNYRPESLICAPGATNKSSCLTGVQASIVRRIFSPLLGEDGSMVYPRMQPGSELDAFPIYYSGSPIYLSYDWFRYAIYDNPSWDPSKISVEDYANSWSRNPSDVNTWNGNLSAFSGRGGKILTFHGQQDAVITSAISEEYYNLAARTMNLPSAELDNFYRFFRIGGMGHCFGGPGAWAMGQTSAGAVLDPERNVLLAVVRWVEEGVAPNGIIGTKFVNDNAAEGVEFERRHCKYPLRNVCVERNCKHIGSWRCV